MEKYLVCSNDKVYWHIMEFDKIDDLGGIWVKPHNMPLWVTQFSIIIPYSKFNPNEIEQSLKHNIQKF